jgi:hypothetical protein
MKKALVGLFLALGTVLSVGGVASAYPPDEPTVGVSTPTPSPGGTFTVTVENCPDGTTVTFVLGSSTTTAVSSGGTATGTLTAPTTPGSYTGTATCGTDVLSFGITVTAAATTVPTTVAPVLPPTGGDGPGTFTTMAIGLLVAGAGLLGVTHVRRRRIDVA